MDPEEIYEYCYNFILDIYENSYFEPDTGLLVDLTNIYKIVKYVYENKDQLFRNMKSIRLNNTIIAASIVILYYNTIGLPIPSSWFYELVHNKYIVKYVYLHLSQNIDFKTLGIRPVKDLTEKYLNNIKKTLINYYILEHNKDPKLTERYFNFLFSLIEKLLPEFTKRYCYWQHTIILVLVYLLSYTFTKNDFYCSREFYIRVLDISIIFGISTSIIYKINHVFKNSGLKIELEGYTLVFYKHDTKLLTIDVWPLLDKGLIKRDLQIKIEKYCFNTPMKKKLTITENIILLIKTIIERDERSMIRDKELIKLLENFNKKLQRSLNNALKNKASELNEWIEQLKQQTKVKIQ